jgi:hypothetical protein
MRNETLYHGTDGDSILAIMATGVMRPGEGKIFFSRHRWEDSLMHGGDTARKASFVIKVAVSIPENIVSYNTSTPGVGVTFVVETVVPLHAEVLELYVRKPTSNGFEGHHARGALAIRQALL